MPDSYGIITTDAAQAHVDAYLNQEDRNHQMDTQLLMCLQATLDANSKKMMANKIDEYTRNVAAAGQPPVMRQSGVLYLLAILKKVDAESQVVGSQICKELSQLDSFMTNEAVFDIKMFNEHAKDKMNTLTNHHQTCDDILDFIFDAFDEVPNEDFKLFACKNRSHYESGNPIEWKDLLNRAEAIFNNKMLRKKWNQQSADKEELIALRAAVEVLKKSPKASSPMPSSNEGGAPKKRNCERLQKDEHGHPIFTGDQTFRNVKPKPRESHVKMVNGKEWKWCEHYGYWCSHTTTECRNKDKLSPKDKSTANSATITAAMAHIGIEDVVSDKDE